MSNMLVFRKSGAIKKKKLSGYPLILSYDLIHEIHENTDYMASEKAHFSQPNSIDIFLISPLKHVVGTH